MVAADIAGFAMVAAAGFAMVDADIAGFVAGGGFTTGVALAKAKSYFNLVFSLVNLSNSLLTCSTSVNMFTCKLYKSWGSIMVIFTGSSPPSNSLL